MPGKDALILDLSCPKHKAILRNHINTLEGKHWIEITRCRDQRSRNQNAYMWSAVYPAVRAGLEKTWGESLTLEDVHEFLKWHLIPRRL